MKFKQNDGSLLAPGEHEREIAKFFGSLQVPASARMLAPEVCVMLFSNRSGSSLVCDYMRATGRFSGMGEPLNHPLVAQRSARHGIESFYGYLEWLMENVHKPDTMFGMKASADQALMMLSSGAIPTCYGRVNWLVAKRRDILAQAVSHWIAAQTDQWASFDDGNKKAPKYSYTGIKSQVLGVIESNRQIEEFCASSGIEPIEIFYEDFLDSPVEQTAALAERLGFSSVAVDPAHLKRKKQAGSLNREFMEKFRQDLDASSSDLDIKRILER